MGIKKEKVVILISEIASTSMGQEKEIEKIRRTVAEISNVGENRAK